MKAVKSTTGQLIWLHDILDVMIDTEECTGDGEGDRINTWSVDVRTRSGKRITVYEAPGFDSQIKWFDFTEAVKGANYTLAKNRADELKKALTGENVEFV